MRKVIQLSKQYGYNFQFIVFHDLLIYVYFFPNMFLYVSILLLTQGENKSIYIYLYIYI